MASTQVQVVMTIMGPDKTGLVEAVAEVVDGHGGNWLESRMAHLAGQFAGILRIEVDRDRADTMVTALKALDAVGLAVIVQRCDWTPEPQRHRVLLELAGSDHPGIVHYVTEVLASRGVNIEEFSSQVTTTPMTGNPMFEAGAVLQVPEGLDLDQLRTALESVAADLMVDINLSEHEP